MIRRFLKYLITKGVAHLHSKNDHWYPPFSERQDKILKLEMQVSDLRLEIIKDYDAFIGQMGNVYFGLLAEAKDPTKTTMTKHWVDSFEKMHTQYQKHLELMKEINRIRIVANPL